MMLGELIFSETAAVYSPIVERPAIAAMFSFYVSQKGGTSPSLVITIEHKNRDETTWSTTSLTAITDTVSVAQYMGDLRELVRIKFVLSGTNAWMRVFTFAPVSQ